MGNTVFTLDEIRMRIAPIAYKYGIKEVYLFGSYARGEADENSDLDFYIEKGKLRSLFQLGGFICDLEDEFKCHVDVLSGEIQDGEFYNHIMNEVISVYEEQKRYSFA